MCKNGPKSVGQFYGVDRKGGWGVDHKRGGASFQKQFSSVSLFPCSKFSQSVPSPAQLICPWVINQSRANIYLKCLFNCQFENIG